jgi:DNA-binding MarR family transcriptional regulator
MRNQATSASQAVAKSSRRGRLPSDHSGAEALAAEPVVLKAPAKGAKAAAAPKVAQAAEAAEPMTARRTAQAANAAANAASDQLVGILRDTIVSLVRRDGPDLSARQLGVFLTCYLQEGAHTVRGLAADLNVSKPAITRALDRLGELDLARRKVDPMDRRSVLVQRTLKGTAFLRDLRGIMTEAAAPKKTNGEAMRKAG